MSKPKKPPSLSVGTDTRRMVLGEGRMRYTASKRLVLQADNWKEKEAQPILWPEFDFRNSDPIVRLILEVVEDHD